MRCWPGIIAPAFDVSEIRRPWTDLAPKENPPHRIHVSTEEKNVFTATVEQNIGDALH